METFRGAFSGIKSLLYLGDNAGETVFDRVLIETLDIPTTYVVKDGPVINDATYEDAVAAGLDQEHRLLPRQADRTVLKTKQLINQRPDYQRGRNQAPYNQAFK